MLSLTTLFILFYLHTMVQTSMNSHISTTTATTGLEKTNGFLQSEPTRGEMKDQKV